MSLAHKQLLEHCVEVLDTFQPELRSVEQHVNNYMAKLKNIEDSDQTFITEVFSGCVRYDSVLNVVLDGFYIRSGKSSLRSESNLYKVLTYLALFRLDELEVAHYRKFVKSQDVNKMYKFLNFFMDDKNLRTWIKDEWNKLYERPFVQMTLLSPLLRWLPELQEMIQQLADKIANKVKPKKQIIPTTEPKAFNLTQPRPRSVPMPEPIPKLEKHKPVPKTTYQDPKQKRIIEENKVMNRRKAEERLMESSRYQFACANPEKSDKTRHRLQSILAEQESKLEFDKHKANPLPNFVSENIPIKLNAATILREGKLFQKREEEELRKLERLEAGAKDASDFLRWQQEMRKQDMDRQLAEIEQRRLEGKLSHEDAILARQNLIKDNKQKVTEMKEEAKAIMQEYLEKKFKEEQEMRVLVEQTMEGHQNTKEAKKKLKDYKRKIVQDVNEESKELMRQALEEAEAEMRRKMEIIQQIRAMEAVPAIRVKFVDFTKTAGYGLLSEFSLAELKERLALMKMAEREAEEEKRDEILASKEAKDQLLMNTLETISKHRSEMTKAAANRLEIKKKTRQTKPEVRDDKVLELEKKLAERKAARLEEQGKERLDSRKQTQRARSFINAKRASEEKRWEELEKTKERTAKLTSQGMYNSKGANKLMASNRISVVT
ncbi:cilia- and flagella-associated protein 99 isoform X1 [Lingula anatina]|uniref:Cilia- and flagella-associated protein 99 isoform X1 n=1 Tax=Lingula anatina TaxID=7574 RepID=A0A1S3K0F9_LINAN|nr:cilia- and flagella-associated protein 99 isoform X1 [Lingula anatina]|eukprot:XP_013415844.1 cilia- and flagella-associated protein 99 isoform X1 [Lingula anatina]